MRHLARLFAALTIPLLALRLGAGQFSMPLVDVSPNEVGRNALYAIWSSTNVSVAANTTIGVIFPPDVVIPGSFNPTAASVFMRYTSNSGGAWTANEVTVTAGSYSGSGSYIALSLPATIYPGKFYVRFDTSANFTNPSVTGTATLAIVDGTGDTVISNGFYIRPTFSASVQVSSISGTVKDSYGKAIPGALVLASSYGNYLPISISARLGWVQPMSVSQNAISAATGGDGAYNLSVPPGSYTVKAEVWRHKNGVLQSVISSPQNADVGPNSVVPLNFSVAPLP